MGGGEMRAATALHPHGQIPKAAVVQAQGAITTPSTPAASPFWGRGGDGGPARPPQDTHTHTFQRFYPSESQRLENSSYSGIFIFFGSHYSFGHVIN